MSADRTKPYAEQFENSKPSADHLEAKAGFTNEALADVDPESLLSSGEKKKLKWKLDMFLLPILWMLYFINQIDRAAVGSSTAHGFKTDLDLTGNRYNIGISVFFIFYCLFEVPSNLMLKKVGAKIWLPTLCIAYGVCSLGTTFIKGYGGFITVRIFLAIAECGTSPGISYYMSTFYGPRELSFRIPFFLSAGPLATAISAFWANGYVGLGQIAPLVYGWRNVFFCNSMITFGIGILAFIMLPDVPSKAKLLNEKERIYILARNKKLTAGRETEEGTSGELVARTFRHPFVWFGIIYLFVGNIIANTQTYFLALVLQQEFGFVGNSSNVHTAAVFLAVFGMTLITGFIADRTGHHAGLMLALMVMALVGSCMFMYSTDKSVGYAGAFITGFGGFCQSNLAQGWQTQQFAPFTVRATATALTVSIGSLGGIVAAWIFVPSQALDRYPTGRILLLTFTSIGIVTVLIHWFYIKWENKQRELGKRDHRLNQSPEKVLLLGSWHPEFRYRT